MARARKNGSEGDYSVSEDVTVISAVLESAKDATSLIYRIPILIDIQPQEEETIRLPIHLHQLRHLHLDTNSAHDFVGRTNIFGLYNSSNNAHFPCLTMLRLTFVDLEGFRMMPGLFPVMRRLVLYYVRGPILDLIQVCSRSLKDLRVTLCFSHDQQSPPHGRICLPNLEVLIVHDAEGIVPNLEAPTLRILHADLDEMNASSGPFPSVVEWLTRECHSQFLARNITFYLDNMPQIRHLSLLRDISTLKLCFETLRDIPTLCPHLQSIEFVPKFRLDTNFKEFLEECVARRAEQVPGFSLQFVEDVVQLKRLDQYYTGHVCLFISMHPCLSYRSFRNPLPRSKRRWKLSKQTRLPLFGAKNRNRGHNTSHSRDNRLDTEPGSHSATHFF